MSLDYGGHTSVTLEMFIENSACSLVGHVCYPDSTQGNPLLLQLGVQVLPEGLVGLLRGTIARAPDDGDCIIRYRSGAVGGDVLFDGDVMGGFLFPSGALRVFSNMLTRDYMLDYLKWKRHFRYPVV